MDQWKMKTKMWAIEGSRKNFSLNPIKMCIEVTKKIREVKDPQLDMLENQEIDQAAGNGVTKGGHAGW